MKKIRVIWYKAKWGDGHWIDNAISLWTWLISSMNRKVGPYSHVEIWTAAESGIFQCTHLDILPAQIIGTCWTSTMRGENNGTVKRPANIVINNPARWDYCEIDIDDMELLLVDIFMRKQIELNKGYAKRDLLKFFGLGMFSDKTRNICSEFCNDALWIGDIIKGKGVVSPRRLAWKLKQAGYQIKPLK